jgi:hypothetical protein
MRAPNAPSAIALAISLAACGGTSAPEPARPRPEPAPIAPIEGSGRPAAPPPASAAPAATSAPASEHDATAAPSTESGAAAPCPAGMIYVDTTFCPEVEQRCLKDEYSKSNNITICHEFAPGQRCLGAPRRQRYCIDEYEYPNRKGAHPPVMVDWYDGEGACEAEGKRLCWESEWVAACEGPEKLPFPHGLERDAAACNIDNAWLEPHLDKVYSKKPSIAGPELLRLDQSVPSGAKPDCTSGFGVHDLTGNLDEWVISEKDRGRSKWAGLKGGAWGHVRNACRPITFSHPAEFTYYFISFRCCADPKLPPELASKPAADGVPVWTPPPVPNHKKPGGAPLSRGMTPGR